MSLEDMIEEELGDKKGKKPSKTSKVEVDIVKHIWEAKSSDKPASDYLNHALNWDNKESTGQLIRGLEGLMGSLDKAFMDVVVGGIKKIAEAFKGSERK